MIQKFFSYGKNEAKMKPLFKGKHKSADFSQP